MLNASSVVEGGPFTRYDPAVPNDENSKSCHDLIIVSQELEKYLSKVKVDKLLHITPFRALGQGKICFPDHYAILVELKGIPLASQNAAKGKKVTIWNLNKEDS